MAEQLTLAWGCRKALPNGVRAAWGARLIAPADLVHDRQSFGGDEELHVALRDWLNGGAGQISALAQALDAARGMRWDGRDEAVYVLHADDRGVVLGSPQGSHGYVYVAAWLFSDVPGEGRGYEVTETGRVLTDQDFARLADEAQEGHPDVPVPPEVALQALRACADHHRLEDPVNDLAPLARWIERNARDVGPFQVGDVHGALMVCARRGWARHVEYGRGDGFALTEAGIEAA
jgi:hypothetical protein